MTITDISGHAEPGNQQDQADRDPGQRGHAGGDERDPDSQPANSQREVADDDCRRQAIGPGGPAPRTAPAF
jgi:hypothetical protein